MRYLRVCVVLGRIRPSTRVLGMDGRMSYETGIESVLSGNEVYYTACSLLLRIKNSCSKLQGQNISI